MTSYDGLHFRRACTQLCVAGAILAVSLPGQADVIPGGAPRPEESDACRAWYAHISDLIDQHRHSDEIDDVQFGEVIRLFYEAQAACTAEHFAEGLAVYESIPLEDVKGRLLR